MLLTRKMLINYQLIFRVPNFGTYIPYEGIKCGCLKLPADPTRATGKNLPRVVSLLQHWLCLVGADFTFRHSQILSNWRIISNRLKLVSQIGEYENNMLKTKTSCALWSESWDSIERTGPPKRHWRCPSYPGCYLWWKESWSQPRIFSQSSSWSHQYVHPQGPPELLCFATIPLVVLHWRSSKYFWSQHVPPKRLCKSKSRHCFHGVESSPALLQKANSQHPFHMHHQVCMLTRWASLESWQALWMMSSPWRSFFWIGFQTLSRERSQHRTRGKVRRLKFTLSKPSLVKLQSGCNTFFEG